jgi:hypothetical protein
MTKQGLVGRVGMVRLVGFVAALLIFVVSGLSRTGIAADQQQAKDPHTSDDGMPPPVATFSILGYDPETGEVGGAVQSRVFTLTGVLTADADAGVVATQAIVDVSYGPKGIALLKQGLTPDAIIKAIWESDPDPIPDRWTKQGRQFAVINLKGETATFT